MNSITIEQRLPSARDPNGRKHWRDIGKGARVERDAAALEWRAKLGTCPAPKWLAASLEITWYYKDKSRMPDLDNMVARCKPLWDGMEDAGIMLNDKGIKNLVLHRFVGEPRVVLTVTGTK